MASIISYLGWEWIVSKCRVRFHLALLFVYISFFRDAICLDEIQKVKRDFISATPKFYLFDVGITGYFSQEQISITIMPWRDFLQQLWHDEIID